MSERFQDSFYKLDMRVAIDAPDQRWFLALLGKNLYNELTTLWRVDWPGAPGSYLDLAARPRSVALQAGYRW